MLIKKNQHTSQKVRHLDATVNDYLLTGPLHMRLSLWLNEEEKALHAKTS